MMKKSLKDLLKILILPVAVVGIGAGIFSNFYLSNNRVDYDGDFFRSEKTRGLFTRRIFERYRADEKEGDNVIYARRMICESYYETNVLTGKSKSYLDNHADGSVDDARYFGHFSEHQSLNLPSRDAQDNDFAKNRADFVADMKKVGLIK